MHGDAPFERKEREMKNGKGKGSKNMIPCAAKKGEQRTGRPGSNRGIRDLGNGQFAIRLYVNGRNTVRKIKASSMKEAERMRMVLIDEMSQESAAATLDSSKCTLFS